jgi:integrase
LPVSAVTPRLVLNVLEQTVPAVLDARGTVVHAAGSLWAARPETARGLRARIGAILDWARVKQYREDDNPARWHGNLEYSLSKTQKREHHVALPYGEIAGFVGAVRQQNCVSAAALEFLILTAMRTSEVLRARWDEIDEAAAVWTVPGSRMKMKREHRVPLSSAALAVLARMRAREPSEYVFLAHAPKKPSPAGFPLSNMTLLTLLRRMKRDDITPRGMRSTFHDWAAECTSTASEVAEMSLAHTIKNKVEAACRRGDLFEKRRALMQVWAHFCEGREAPKLCNLASERHE